MSIVLRYRRAVVKAELCRSGRIPSRALDGRGLLAIPALKGSCPSGTAGPSTSWPFRGRIERSVAEFEGAELVLPPNAGEDAAHSCAFDCR
jgi:hypothetical protein